jgi:hypothetical protein
MDLDSFLVSLYVLVDDWWRVSRHSSTPPRPGRPAFLADSEVLTLALLAQWPRFRSERDFWRFADAHLRGYFPDLCSQGQLNRRIRASRRLLLEHALADDPAYLRLAARLSEALEVTETASREARRLRDASQHRTSP